MQDTKVNPVKTKYKAVIYCDTYKDEYREGEGEAGTSWVEEIIGESKSDLKAKICGATYSKWYDVDQEQINGYEHATEYHTSYMADANNEGEATESELRAWRKGELDLWAVHCHILVTEVTERKVTL